MNGGSDKPVIDFRSELTRVIAEQFPKRLTISLLNGERYTIESALQLILGPNVGTVFFRDGKEAFFPFYSICSVEIEHET